MSKDLINENINEVYDSMLEEQIINDLIAEFDKIDEAKKGKKVSAAGKARILKKQETIYKIKQSLAANKAKLKQAKKPEAKARLKANIDKLNARLKKHKGKAPAKEAPAKEAPAKEAPAKEEKAEKGKEKTKLGPNTKAQIKQKAKELASVNKQLQTAMDLDDHAKEEKMARRKEELQNLIKKISKQGVSTKMGGKASPSESFKIDMGNVLSEIIKELSDNNTKKFINEIKKQIESDCARMVLERESK